MPPSHAADSLDLWPEDLSSNSLRCLPGPTRQVFQTLKPASEPLKGYRFSQVGSTKKGQGFFRGEVSRSHVRNAVMQLKKSDYFGTLPEGLHDGILQLRVLSGGSRQPEPGAKPWTRTLPAGTPQTRQRKFHNFTLCYAHEPGTVGSKQQGLNLHGH